MSFAIAFYIKFARNCVAKIVPKMLDFDSDPQTCDTALISTINNLNIAKSNCIFPGKRGKDRALILTYLDFIFVNFGHLQGIAGVQSWTKCAKLRSALFP